jgi:hypothetical protein
MQFPSFFDQVPRLQMRDPLAAFLGAAENGVIEYSYLDAVKLAGHSCPTVASAYWLTHRSLSVLYGEALPERGAIRVELAEGPRDGVAGVVANVVSLLTGAAGETGFKGLGGRFERRALLSFDAGLPRMLRFTRLDNGAQVDAVAHLHAVPADSELPRLMQRCVGGVADAAEAHRFGMLWQERVRRILLEHGDDPEVFDIRRVAASLKTREAG